MAQISSNNQIVVGNLFGFFFTQFLCILSQPVGSLWYARPTSLLGQAIFFFWRLNPLACFAETIIITAALADVLLSAFSGPAVVSRIRQGTAIILLLRKHGGRWRVSSSPPMIPNIELSITERGSSSRREGQPDFQDPPAATAAVVNATSDGDSENQDTIGSLLPGMLQSSPIRDLIPNSGIVIDIFALCANMLVMVKVSVVTLPWYFSAWLWVYLVGWLAVATLLLISHNSASLETLFESEAQLFKLARAREARITRIGVPLAFLPTLSAVVYCSYILYDVLDFDDPLVSLTSSLGPGWNAKIQLPIHFVFSCANLIMVLERCTSTLTNTFGGAMASTNISPVGWGLSILAVIIGLISLAISIDAEYLNRATSAIFEFGSEWHMYFGVAHTTIFSGSCLFVPVLGRRVVGERLLVLTHAWSISHFIQVSILLFARYDPRDTYAPSWVEWLG